MSFHFISTTVNVNVTVLQILDMPCPDVSASQQRWRIRVVLETPGRNQICVVMLCEVKTHLSQFLKITLPQYVGEEKMRYRLLE